jgi:hypothetical protein
MADLKISQLPSVANPAISDYLVGDFSNSSYTGKLLISNLVQLLGVNTTISSGTINNTPIGSAVPSTGAFTNLSYTGYLKGGLGLNYADTGILGSIVSSVNSYNQFTLQNQSNGAVASTNFNVSNDQATATTNFGEFGINSSGFTGTGAFNQAGYTYLASGSTDLAIGTYGANSIHFIVNSGATDAMTINGSTGTLTVNTATTFNAGATGNITGNITGNVTGNLTGNASGTSANITGIAAIGNGGTGQSTAPAALIALGERTGANASLVVPSGTTAQRDASPQFGYFRTNTSTNQVEWYNGSAWTSVGGGATGAGGDAAFNENDELVTTSYTIGQGAMMSGVTVTIATPAVFTLANHGFVVGQPIRLTTTGALPTGLTTNSQYFVLSSGLTSSTFQVGATTGGSAIATSGTQSGVHSVGKSKNASMVGPLVAASGVTLTIPSGSRLVVQ